MRVQTTATTWQSVVIPQGLEMITFLKLGKRAVLMLHTFLEIKEDNEEVLHMFHLVCFPCGIYL